MLRVEVYFVTATVVSMFQFKAAMWGQNLPWTQIGLGDRIPQD
jgi:hypothetical protein